MERKLQAVRLADRIVIFALLAALFGCAGQGLDTRPAPALSESGGSVLIGGSNHVAMPAIPLDRPEDKQASVLQDDTVLGKDFLVKSANATVAGNDMALNAGAKQMEWTIWRYVLGTSSPKTATFNINASSGNTWIGIANYGTMQWDVKGPFPFLPLGQRKFQNLDAVGANYISPAGNIYLMVLAFDSTSSSVQSITMNVDSTATVFSISGTVTNTAGGGGLAGVLLTASPGGQQAASSGTGAYSFSGLSAGLYSITPSLSGFTFAPPNQNVNVGPDATGIDFAGTGGATTFTISGRVTDTAGGGGLAGVQMLMMPGGQLTTTNGSGNYSYTGVAAGTYSIVPGFTGYDFNPATITGITVGPDSSGNDFAGTAQGGQVTYTNDIKPLLDNSTNPTGSCTECHNAGLPSGGFRFDTYTTASTNASSAYAAIGSGSMPQGKPDWSAADKALFNQWIIDGKPL